MKTIKHAMLLALSALTLASVPLVAAPMGTAFTYQGRLNDNDAPAPNGIYDFEFTLYDAATAGGTVGSAVPINAVPVTNGLFTVSLDFGAAAFTSGEARWLQMRVNTNGVLPLATLSPRQHLTPTPQALYAPNAGVASVANGVSPSTIIQGQSLKMGTNNILIGTFASIAGGGSNTVNGSYAVIAGGLANTASNNSATIGGGSYNIANGNHALVAGGEHNSAMGDHAFVGGGAFNSASGYDVVSGGLSNSVSADTSGIGSGFGNQVSGYASWLGGGQYNQIIASYSFIGGGIANQIGSGGTFNEIGGGRYNVIQSFGGTIASASSVGGGAENAISGAAAATVAGGGGNHIGVSADYASIGGGGFNSAQAFGSTIGGGYVNSISSLYATIGGGQQNTVQGQSAVIGGGEMNHAGGSGATVAGGERNTTDGATSLVAGGSDNYALGIASAIGGGIRNKIDSGYGNVGGGDDNWIQSQGFVSGVLSGRSNTVAGAFSVVANGEQNTIPASQDYSIATGKGAVARLAHSETHAAMFSTPGDGQCAHYVATVSSVGGLTEWELYGPTVPISGAFAFTALISGKAFGDGSAAFEVKGLIRRYGNSPVAFVGTPSVTSLGHDGVLNNATVIPYADNNGTWYFAVGTGGSSTLQAHWIAYITTTEIVF